MCASYATLETEQNETETTIYCILSQGEIVREWCSCGGVCVLVGECVYKEDL